MKRWLAPGLLAAFLLAGVCAEAGQLGAPEPPGSENQDSLAAGYFLNTLDMKPRSAGFSSVEFEQNQIVAAAAARSFGYAEGLGGYFKAGVSDIDDGRGFRDGYKPFARAGVKWMPLRWSRFGFGATVEGGLQSNYEVVVPIPGGSATGRVRNLWDVKAGVGPQASFGDFLTVYGGALAAYARADIWTESTFQGKLFAKYRTTDGIGGFAGARIALPRGVSVEVEAQSAGVFSGGAALAYSY